jgi:hypothetical protein
LLTSFVANNAFIVLPILVERMRTTRFIVALTPVGVFAIGGERNEQQCWGPGFRRRTSAGCRCQRWVAGPQRVLARTRPVLQQRNLARLIPAEIAVPESDVSRPDEH